MQRLLDFWSANHNEILMTGLIVLLIQLYILATGVLTRRKSMRRVDEDPK
jgi:hypothetical protein